MNDQDIELCVWFDGDCPVCQRVASWLNGQDKYVPLHCVPAQNAAGAGCPLTVEALLDKVTVTASDGAIYRGTNAWLICLWALRGYRGWSLRMAGPGLRPWAERLFGIIAGLASWSKGRVAGSNRPQ